MGWLAGFYLLSINAGRCESQSLVFPCLMADGNVGPRDWLAGDVFAGKVIIPRGRVP